MGIQRKASSALQFSQGTPLGVVAGVFQMVNRRHKGYITCVSIGSKILRIPGEKSGGDK